ncbi:MAG TPA: PAS domain S-box protein [Polyangiaceae bacterium]|jgi:rsbT co-antagonist protein RsbR|nr:PAS domain S-box protein [Polyangiaceae bacterium]
MGQSKREATGVEAFFDECPLMAVVADAGGRIQRANSAFVEELGYSADEILSMSIGTLAHPDDQAAVAIELASLGGTSAKKSFLSRIRRQDGEVRWFRFWCSRSGSPGVVFITAADVTQWKAEDDARRSNEARLATIVREAPFGIIEFGVGGKVLSWNPGAERIFGYSTDEALDKTSGELIDPPGHEGGAERRGKALLEQRGMAATLPNRTRDGKEILCEWQLLLVRDDAGAVFSVAALVRDVTERVRIEDELRSRRDLLRLLVENVPLILWTVDMNGIFTYAEGTGLTALQARPGELVGESFFGRFRDYPIVVDSVWRALQGDNSLHTTEFAGHVWENRYLVMRDAQGQMTGVAGMFHDMTERVRTEQELRRRLEVIEWQKSAIRALSMPIIHVAEGVLALPVIGEIDHERAVEISQTLLRAVVKARARYAIIDLTGVDFIDTATVSHLLKVINAVELVGSSPIIAGIQPTMASMLVSLGVDLSNLRAVRSLREAIKLTVPKPHPGRAR